MKAYRTQTRKLTGTAYDEVYPAAYGLYKQIRAKSKRRPYVRSAYFNKDKVFLGIFWEHLSQKNWRDRVRRLKFFPCGIELIKKSKFAPISKEDPNNAEDILHRFAGTTAENDLFFVQIKEDKKTDQKYLLSIFPEQK